MNLQQYDEYDEVVKVIVVGNSGSGKTNMIHTFDKGVALNHSAPTVGVDYYSKNMDVDSNHKIKLQIWDTAGQEQFRSIIMGHYKNAAGALVVFDVTNLTSFKDVRRWVSEVRERADQHVVLGIIGNKADLPNRVISPQEGQGLANQQQAFYMQTSIYNVQTLRNAFQRLAKEIYRAGRSKNLQFSRGSTQLTPNKGESNCSC